MSKTNAIRLLEKSGLEFEVREYAVDLDDLSAPTVARKVGLPAEQVFKTLVTRGDRQGVMLAVVPGNAALDLKALARVSDNRKVEMVPLKEVHPLTGYLRGGVTALACKKPYPVFLDETAQLFERIAVSAGTRGAQVLLPPQAYVDLTRAVMADISVFG